MEKEKTYCNFCKKKIENKALICPHCNSYFPRARNSIWSWIIVIFGIIIKLIIPFIIITITVYQCDSAQKEKNSAIEARQLADTALINVNNHIDEIRRFQALQMKIEDEAEFKIFISKPDWNYKSLSSALIRSGSSYGSIYSNMLFLNNAAQQGGEINDKNVQKYYFDLFEVAFLNWYFKEFSKKWNDFNIINPTLVKSNMIKNQLSINKCLRALDSEIDTWFLPSDCELIISQKYPIDTMPFQIPIEVHSTSITIKNQNFNFSIIFSNSLGFGKVEKSDFEESVIYSYIPNDNIWVQTIKVEFLAEIIPKNCLSENTQLEYNWIKEFIHRFKNDFDWRLVRSDLQEINYTQ